MLDNSEQDLDSSYRETQDSDAEDTSSTNGSASEQNLFIFLSESDSENSDIATARPESDIARFGQGQIRTGSRPDSDIATARPEKKMKKIEEESGSETEDMNIKLEVFTQLWN